MENDYTKQIADFEKRTFNQLAAETSRVNTSFTDLQTTVGVLLSKTGPTESEVRFQSNEKLLTQLRHTYFDEYNNYEIEVIDKKQNNNNSKLNNLHLLKANQILLTYDLDASNKPIFELIGYINSEETIEKYRIGTHLSENIVIEKLRNSNFKKYPKLIYEDKSLKELLLRIIILRKLRLEGLLNKTEHRKRILNHCHIGLRAILRYSDKEQIARNNHALILHSAAIKSKDSTHDDNAKEVYSTQKLIEHIVIVKQSINTIQNQLLLANVNFTISEGQISPFSNEMNQASLLNEFYLELQKFKNEIGKLYFVMAGNLFESAVLVNQASSTALSNFVVNPHHMRENAEIDPHLILELSENYNSLTQYIQLMNKEILKSTEAQLRAELLALESHNINASNLHGKTVDLYMNEKIKAKRTKALNLKLLKSLRFKLIPEYNAAEIKVTYNGENYILENNQFNLIRFDQQKNNIQYKLSVFLKKNNLRKTYLLGSDAYEDDLISEINSSYSDRQELAIDKITLESLIQIAISKALDEEQLNDNYIVNFRAVCERASAAFDGLRQLNISNNNAQDVSDEICNRNIINGLHAIKEIQKILLTPNFTLNNNTNIAPSAEYLYTELCEIQKTLGKLGFILMNQSSTLKPSIINSDSPSSPWKKSANTDRCNLNNLDEQKIIILYDICQDLSQHLLLTKKVSNDFYKKVTYVQ